MSNAYQHWVDLSESDVRSMLIALIGLDFGPEPEARVPEIKQSRKNYSNQIADQVNLSANDTMIDLGSGCGFGTYWFAQRAKHVHACDISPAYLKFAARECSDLRNISFHQITSRRLTPIADQSIDVVCSMSVFIHLNLYDIYWYFSEFARVVRPRGRVWFDFADSESLDLKTPNANGGYFIKHAKDYDGDPTSLPGLMQWNSLKAVTDIARVFGFKCTKAQNGGNILLVKT